MLLRFGTANHLSMRDQQEISLAASSLKDAETSLIECPAVPSGYVLPSAVIYGANASGKSNFVAALGFMRRAVLYSHIKGEPGGRVPRNPFLLDPAYSEASSRFDIDFTVDGVRYHYGFEVNDEFFDAEWLYRFRNNRRQMLFERNRASFKFGRGLSGHNKVISDLTRPNSLFLSAAAQNDHKQLSEVVGFFQSLQIDADISVEGGRALEQLADRDVDDRVVEFLGGMGTGVVGLRRQKKEVSENMKAFRRELESALKNFSEGRIDIDLNSDGEDVSIELAHRSHDGETVYFDLKRESAGTRRLLVLLGRAFHVLDEGDLLVIDELDASLHTRACEAVLALFSSPVVNARGAQMIATTHDANLLSSPLLRRDQVWFTEKDGEGATHLYPLTDIRTRKGDNIEKGYLQGRYGAIPFTGSAAALVAAE